MGLTQKTSFSISRNLSNCVKIANMRENAVGDSKRSERRAYDTLLPLHAKTLQGLLLRLINLPYQSPRLDFVTHAETSL